MTHKFVTSLRVICLIDQQDIVDRDKEPRAVLRVKKHMRAFRRPETVIVVTWTELTQQTIWVLYLATDNLPVPVDACHLVLTGM